MFASKALSLEGAFFILGGGKVDGSTVFDYYYGDESSQFSFYRIPRQLVAGQQFKKISTDAKLLYGDWKKNFGRQVKRGEHGITILAPCPYRRQEEVEETAPDGSPSKSVQWVQRMSFRTVTVFDISQTEGKQLPEICRKLTGDVEQYESMVAAIRSISPYPIHIERFPSDAYGCCNFAEQRIFVQPDMSQAQTIKTMIHEVSHAKLHAPIEDGDGETPPQRKRRFVREMEAESVAYVVCQHFGIDTSDYSFGYVAGWSHGKDLSQLKASLELIRNTAAELIDGIAPPKELPPPTQKKQRTKRRNVYERS